MRNTLSDPSIPKNYTSVYNKEFYEKNITENTKKIEKILEDMKKIDFKAARINNDTQSTSNQYQKIKYQRLQTMG